MSDLHVWRVDHDGLSSYYVARTAFEAREWHYHQEGVRPPTSFFRPVPPATRLRYTDECGSGDPARDTTEGTAAELATPEREGWLWTGERAEIEGGTRG